MKKKKKIIGAREFRLFCLSLQVSLPKIDPCSMSLSAPIHSRVERGKTGHWGNAGHGAERDLTVHFWVLEIASSMHRNFLDRFAPLLDPNIIGKFSLA